MQGEDALSWDSDELNRIQNLHLRAFDSLEVRQQQGNSGCRGEQTAGSSHTRHKMSVLSSASNSACFIVAAVAEAAAAAVTLPAALITPAYLA